VRKGPGRNWSKYLFSTGKQSPLLKLRRPSKENCEKLPVGFRFPLATCDRATLGLTLCLCSQRQLSWAHHLLIPFHLSRTSFFSSGKLVWMQHKGHRRWKSPPNISGLRNWGKKEPYPSPSFPLPLCYSLQFLSPEKKKKVIVLA